MSASPSLTLPHRQGIPFLSQRLQMTSPRTSSEASTHPFPLSLGGPSTLSSSSGLLAKSNDSRNSCRHGTLSRGGPSSSWRSRFTMRCSSSSHTRCSSSCARASSSAHTRASSAWCACSSVHSYLRSSSSNRAFSAATWASSLAHSLASLASHSSSSAAAIWASSSSCAVLSSWAVGIGGGGSGERSKIFFKSPAYSAPAIHPVDSPNSAMQDQAWLDLEGGYCYTPCNTTLELRSTLLHDPNLF